MGNQDQNKSDNITKQVGNPTGKGGFGDHPENINRQGLSLTQNYISHWYRRFLDMPTSEFKKWESENPDAPVAAMLAYAGIVEARNRIKSRIEVTDRTEGKAPQRVQVDLDRISNKQLADQIQNILNNEIGLDVKSEAGEDNKQSDPK